MFNEQFCNECKSLLEDGFLVSNMHANSLGIKINKDYILLCKDCYSKLFAFKSNKQ